MRPRPWWPLRPARAAQRNAPRVTSASLEGLTPPRARSASLEASTVLGRGPPRSRPRRSSGGDRLARGLNPPSGEVRLARGHLHTRRPHSCPRVRAFNALTPQDARHDPGTPGNRVPALFHQLPREDHPRHYVALCGRPRDTAPPTPVQLTRRALEGGPATPSNAFSVITQGHAVTSGRRDRSSPSLSALCGHPRHCHTTSGTVTTS
jgi:hypothetical protein